MGPWDLALRIVLLGFSAILLLVGIKAFRRVGGKRMAWVVVSFSAFTILAASVLLGAVYDSTDWSISNYLVLLLLLIIGADYLALLKD